MASHPADTAFDIPFFAPHHRLPAPLPTQAEIEASDVVLEDFSGRRVVVCGKFYVVKYGANVSLMEGENMLFVRATQAVPVPDVFALYSKTDANGCPVQHIVTEYISGQSLDKIWTRLDSSQKAKLSAELRHYFDALRSLPDPGYFGCIGKRPFEDTLFWNGREDMIGNLISGPFTSEEELNNALVEKYLHNTKLVHKASFYRRVLPRVLKNSRSIFSHGDLQRKNMIVKDDGSIVVIDWESAGWYPEYWEYALAMFACGAWRDDWHEYVPRILVEYPNAYAWFAMLGKELWWC